MAKQSPRTNTLLVSYFLHHIRVFFSSLGHLTRNPVASLMTSTVIAIALSLPAIMFIAINNISYMSSGWDSSTKISLFLHTDIDQERAEKLAKKLGLHKKIRTITVISKDEGLNRFKDLSGFGEALDLLERNPLPVVLDVEPVVDPTRPDDVRRLIEELEEKPEVEIAQLDIQWVKRLYAILELINNAVWIIGCLLAIAVLLIVGNTIRLDIQNRREEIEVSKLIGASDAFIRRPFLYTGLWYGLSGGLLAWALTATSLYLLSAPVNELASLYSSRFQLSGLVMQDIIVMIGLSCTLGLAGSWISVGRHLSEIEPS